MFVHSIILLLSVLDPPFLEIGKRVKQQDSRLSYMQFITIDAISKFIIDAINLLRGPYIYPLVRIN